jgi:hypothetical protein
LSVDGKSRSGALMKPIVADILFSSKKLLQWTAANAS